MSEARIKELFGEMTGEEIIDLFTYGGTKYRNFERLEKEILRCPTHSYFVGLFVVRHKPTGELYGLEETNLNSWEDNSSTAYDYGYSIYPLSIEEVTINQYKIVGEPTVIDVENDW